MRQELHDAKVNNILYKNEVKLCLPGKFTQGLHAKHQAH